MQLRVQLEPLAELAKRSNADGVDRVELKTHARFHRLLTKNTVNSTAIGVARMNMRTKLYKTSLLEYV